jgi:hypothetical protein
MSLAFKNFLFVLKKDKSSLLRFEDYARLDMKCLACLLAEIVYFNKLKCMPQENSLETRCLFITKLIRKEPHLLTG